MTDVTRLADLLEQYVSTLKRNRRSLEENYNSLEKFWNSTRNHYRGRGADYYAEAFKRAGVTLKLYTEETARMVPILEQKINHLKSMDERSDPGV